MNYAKHYWSLIERANTRTLTGYVEKHHVIPRCIGGDDYTVTLTPEEHYVAHQLLVKMNPGNEKLLWAAMNMTGKARTNTGRRNKLYGWLRRRLAERVSKRLKGVPKTAEHRAALAKAKLGTKRGPHSAETRRKQSEGIRAALARLGRLDHFDDPAYRALQSARTKAVWDRRKSAAIEVHFAERLG